MADVRTWSEDAVSYIELCAPARRNALNRSMLVELGAAIEAVRQDHDARALVVRATGPAFCAGADLADIMGDLTRPSALVRDDLKKVYSGFLGLRELRIPTIAAVRGPAVGAGFNIAMVCDVVLVHPDARFIISFADLSLHPGGGCTWFLTNRLGPAGALVTLLEAEQISAERAVRLGLAAEVTSDPEHRAGELATRWAGRDPSLVQDIKRAVRMSESASLDDVLELESWAQASSAGTEAFRHALASRSRAKQSANKEGATHEPS